MAGLRARSASARSRPPCCEMIVRPFPAIPKTSMTAKSCTRLFGTTRRQVACIGQGTWKIDDSAADGSLAALRRGLDLGLTHIDTAEMYGSGASERIVGNAISGRRDEVFLVSKVLPSHASNTGVAAACEKSLARLRTDRL